MKIRADFVTNSSSASFILTAKEDILDFKIENFKKMGYSGKVQLLTFFRDELKREGNKTRIGDEEYYYTVKEFRLGKTCMLTDEVDEEEITGADFSQFSDEEMWDLINWIAVKGKSQDLYGIGVTQVTDVCNCTCEHPPEGA
ncbi:MAG: hypothetical protein ABSC17_08520 [Thermacetogeniaceae bacterium]